MKLWLGWRVIGIFVLMNFGCRKRSVIIDKFHEFIRKCVINFKWCYFISILDIISETLGLNFKFVWENLKNIKKIKLES